MANKVKAVNTNLCKGCGICVAFCPKQVLTLENEKAVIKNIEDCIGCGQCELRCPDSAIYLGGSDNE